MRIAPQYAVSSADLRQPRWASARATSPLKTRVGGFGRRPSGRPPRWPAPRCQIASGCTGYRDEIASGRAYFLNRDPIEEAGGINLYGFCGNDGINRFDLMGNSWFSHLLREIARPFEQIGHAIERNWKPIVAIGVGILSGGIAAALAPVAWSGWAVGALAGGVGGFVGSATGAALNGASLEGTLRAGVTGGIIGGITGGVLGGLGIGTSLPRTDAEFLKNLAIISGTGGVAGGIDARLNGGSFWSGFRTGAELSAGLYAGLTSFQIFATEKTVQMYPTDGPDDPSEYNEVLTNGIGGNADAMQARLDALFSQGTLARAEFNPSNGYILDVLQTVWQGVSLGFGDSLAASLRAGLAESPDAEVEAHSQGTFTYLNAVIQSGFHLSNPAILGSPWMPEAEFDLVNLLNGGRASTFHGGYQGWGDISNLTGWGYNPLKIISFPADIFDGAAIHNSNNPFGPHP